MGFRFWRRIKLAPGVTLNLSKSGGSLSFGRRGARYTVGPHGRRATAGIPGTGLFYTARLPEGTAGGTRRRRRSASAASAPPAPTVRPEDRLTLGFFKRLVTPPEEQALVAGCRELALGNAEAALPHFEQATHLADGAFFAGFLCLQQERLDDAARYLARAAENHPRLDRYLAKYGVTATMSLPVTDEVDAVAGADLRGVLLGLVEAYQRLAQWEEATACLERLRRLEPDDVVVKLSLAELTLEAAPAGDASACRKVVRLAEGIDNATPVHAALLFYKARALRALGLADAAREVLTGALRRKKGRSDELLRALRYERALAYETLGRPRRARSDLERLYAAAPDYADVAERLGLAAGRRGGSG